MIDPTQNLKAEAGLIRVPGYRIERVLGTGAMGTVYEAVHEKLDRRAALKVIKSGAIAGEVERQRFEDEARLLAQLHHPNIVQIFEVGEHEGQPFFSMEFCPEGTLRTQVSDDTSPAEAAALIETLAQAVHAAHEKGVIHRDLKPDNILLDEQRRPKITDFGLAKEFASGSGQTATGAILGTPAYMEPEQTAGRAPEVGPAADIWALGVMLYEMLAGQLPFEGTSVAELLAKIPSVEPTRPRQLRPRLPRDLETVCLKCLEKDPARRYITAQALAEDLRRWRDGLPVLALRQRRIWRLPPLVLALE